MSTIVKPRVARIHYREGTADIRATATGVDTTGLLNNIFKDVFTTETLAGIITWLLTEFAPILPDGTVGSVMPAGDLHALADDMKARYPSGIIPSAPLT